MAGAKGAEGEVVGADGEVAGIKAGLVATGGEDSFESFESSAKEGSC